jgi:hypothetical protein
MQTTPQDRETHPPLGETVVYRTPPLREAVVVYGSRDGLVIRDGTEAPFGSDSERRYEPFVLDRIRQAFAGRSVTVREVYDSIRLGIVKTDVGARWLPNAYAVRDILVILAAMGLAYVDASTAEPVFTLRARVEL